MASFVYLIPIHLITNFNVVRSIVYLACALELMTSVFCLRNSYYSEVIKIFSLIFF